MPPSLHIILIHGPLIIQNTPLPIGKLSEEALETTHKVIRRFRKHHARNTSRVKTNEDVFKRLLINSDPKISKIRCNFLPKKKAHKLSDDMINLINFNPDPRNNLNDDFEENQPMETSSDLESDIDNEIDNLLF